MMAFVTPCHRHTVQSPRYAASCDLVAPSVGGLGGSRCCKQLPELGTDVFLRGKLGRRFAWNVLHSCGYREWWVAAAVQCTQHMKHLAARF
jgi:hypothetical protein